MVSRASGETHRGPERFVVKIFFLPIADEFPNPYAPTGTKGVYEQNLAREEIQMATYAV
jgi:hypothetical protein